jgi:hypothetical protein
MFGVCPEVNPKISYAGTAAYMLHVKQLPDISQSVGLRCGYVPALVWKYFLEGRLSRSIKCFT